MCTWHPRNSRAIVFDLPPTSARLLSYLSSIPVSKFVPSFANCFAARGRCCQFTRALHSNKRVNKQGWHRKHNLGVGLVTMLVALHTISHLRCGTCTPSFFSLAVLRPHCTLKLSDILRGWLLRTLAHVMLNLHFSDLPRLVHSIEAIFHQSAYCKARIAILRYTTYNSITKLLLRWSLSPNGVVSESLLAKSILSPNLQHVQCWITPIRRM